MSSHIRGGRIFLLLGSFAGLILDVGQINGRKTHFLKKFHPEGSLIKM